MTESEPLRCRTCMHWLKYTSKYPAGGPREEKKAGGWCQSEKLTEGHWQSMAADMLAYSYMEGGEFWTGPDFGCVHHTGAGK